jgi:PAS domain-containing protein
MVPLLVSHPAPRAWAEGDFETVLEAMTFAIKTLRGLLEWNEGVEFEAQGMGPRTDTYRIAIIHTIHGPPFMPVDGPALRLHFVGCRGARGEGRFGSAGTEDPQDLALDDQSDEGLVVAGVDAEVGVFLAHVGAGIDHAVKQKVQVLPLIARQIRPGLAALVTVIVLFFSTLAAYALSCLNWVGRTAFGFFLFFTQMMPEAMIVINQSGVIQSYGASAERMFAWRPSEVMGRNISMLMPEPDRGRGAEHDDRRPLRAAPSP